MRDSKFLFHLLTAPRHHRHRERGFSMVVGMLVVFSLLVASVALAYFASGGLNFIGGGSAANQAQTVAESGADQIIALLNRPENRKLLVSGDITPNTTNWTTTNAALRSPCVDTSSNRPSASGPTTAATGGYPSSTAVALVDGNFRNLQDITQTNQGARRFQLKAIRYSTGTAGASDRRSIYRTYPVVGSLVNTTPNQPAGSPTFASVGTIPTGNTFSDLNNLTDPDGVSGSLLPGANSGFIAITVEGRIYNGSTQIGSTTITREYQVIPKCCGASFGSNGSGGVDVTSPTATNPSLGSDSRYCGIDFGMLTGINGGKMWTYYSNDYYSQRVNGQVVRLNSMLGLVDQSGDPFSRANATIGGRNVGCRVIPGPCSTSSDVYVSGTSDVSNYNYITSLGGVPNGNITSVSDINGTSASNVPIVPLALTGGLPSIASKYAYTWTVGGRPEARLAASPQQYPSFTSSSTSLLIGMRSRNDTTPPRVEICASYSGSCSATSWAQISTSGTLSIGDDFSSGDYSGSTTGTVNRWPGSWVETDPGSSTAPLWTTGLVTINSGALRITGDGAATTQAVRRFINLDALQSPYLKFTYTRSASPQSLIVEYSVNNGSSYTTIATIAATTTSGSSQTFALPAAAQTPYTILRFRPGATLANAEWIAIDDVAITNSTGGAVSYDNWCEYSSTFPNITPNPYYVGGFHCIGPTLAFQLGGNFRVDTSGGGISWYYNNSSDTRGAGTNITGTTPVIYMANGAALSHVNCSATIPPTTTVTASDNCTSLISDTVYAPVGQFDMFNIFGRDTSPGGTGSTSMQWIQVGSFAGSTGKVAGAWFYMPWGALYLIADQCGGTGSAVNFNDPNGWNFGGRLWMRLVVPCGTNYFRVPPSSAADLAALVGANPLVSSTRSFVNWTGVDWVARSVVSSRTNWSL